MRVVIPSSGLAPCAQGERVDVTAKRIHVDVLEDCEEDSACARCSEKNATSSRNMPWLPFSAKKLSAFWFIVAWPSE